jgi:hypothetical protein
VQRLYKHKPFGFKKRLFVKIILSVQHLTQSFNLMAEASWSYLQNPFDNTTKKSFKKMLMMATDHFDKLQRIISNNPFIGSVYADEYPKFEKFANLYSQADSNRAIYQSYTYKFEQLISQLSTEKIKRWDIQIQSVYSDDTPEYMQLLPNKRGDFQKGAYEIKMSKLKSLFESLGRFADLAHTQREVSDFYILMKKTRTEQQGYETEEKELSRQLENARVHLANGMRRLYAALLFTYHEDVKAVESFYELKYLRASVSNPEETEQSDTNIVRQLENTIPAKTKNVELDGEVFRMDEILIENSGNTSLEAWTSDDVGTNPPARVALIEAGQSVSFIAKNVSTGIVEKLIIYNPDEAKGKYSVLLTRASTAVDTGGGA